MGLNEYVTEGVTRDVRDRVKPKEKVLMVAKIHGPFVLKRPFPSPYRPDYRTDTSVGVVLISHPHSTGSGTRHGAHLGGKVPLVVHTDSGTVALTVTVE